MSADPFTVVIDWMGRPHTANDERQKKWEPLMVIHKAWLEAGQYWCVVNRPPKLEAARVTAWARYQRGPMTDPDGIAPTVKCVLDGLVTKGVFPTDTGEHVIGVNLLPPVMDRAQPHAIIMYVEPLPAGTMPVYPA